MLVYFAEAGRSGCIEEHQPVLVKGGQKERNEKALNRFRLVLLADDPNEVRQAAKTLFDELRRTDEKVHLQLIDRKAMPYATKSTVDTEENKTE